MKYVAVIDGVDMPVEIVDDHHVRFGGDLIEVDLNAVAGQPLYSLLMDGESYEGYVFPDEDQWQVLLRGQFYTIRVVDERDYHFKSSHAHPVAAGEFMLKAPMPGLIIAIHVEEGQVVEQGQTLMILESMKMQNELRAPWPGKINRVRVKVNDSVEQKQHLLTLGQPIGQD